MNTMLGPGISSLTHNNAVRIRSILTRSPRCPGAGLALASLNLTEARARWSLVDLHPWLKTQLRFSEIEICG